MRPEALDSEGKIIAPKLDCKLLGVTLSRNMTWNSHIKGGIACVHMPVHKRLAALKFLGKHISTEKRLILVNGLVNLLLTYCIHL